MDIERKFEDLGVDAVQGIKLMKLMNISSDDFIEQARFMRFKDVIDYFKDISHPDYIINTICVGKPVDRLDHVWGYVDLSKQKARLNSVLEEKRQKLKDIESLGSKDAKTIVDDMKSELVNLELDYKRLDDQVYAYEK